jgi:uncharacterized protein DUF4412
MKLKNLLLAAAVPALLLATPLSAQFEGVIESKMTGTSSKGQAFASKGMTYVSPKGARMEMDMQGPMGGMKMTTLHRNAAPGVVVFLNDAKKTYSEWETGKPSDSRDSHTWTVKKLGAEKVSGYDTTHALATNEKGEEIEVWVTKELGGAAAFWAGQERRGKSGMFQALHEQGLDGWPMRMKTHQKEGDSITWEVVRVEKKSVPGSLFEVPSGYTKSEGMFGMAGQMQLSPEQQKQMDEAKKRMDEALSKMTPEQRKQYEEMMKSMGGEKK